METLKMALGCWIGFGFFIAVLQVFVLTISIDQANSLRLDVPSPGVRIERWDESDLFSIKDLSKNPTFPDFPSLLDYGANFTQPKNWGKNFATRIRSYFVPKESGPHVFFISSDSYIELYLSDDKLQDHKKLVIIHEKQQKKNKYIESESWPFQLRKGQYYYIESVMKAFEDTNYLSVAVRTPKKFISPITSDYLWTALPKENNSNDQEGKGKESPRIKRDIIKIAAKAGARAGASLGLMAATQSAARAGADILRNPRKNRNGSEVKRLREEVKTIVHRRTI